MQDTSNRILALAREKLRPECGLTYFKVSQLRIALDELAEILDQDSLECQYALDCINPENKPEPDDDYVLLDLSWPESSTEPEFDEPFDFVAHFEKMWGVEYDSDQISSFSDNEL